MRKLVFATNNTFKLKEIRGLLGKGFTILSLNDLHYYEDIPENYLTLEENAQAKAMIIYEEFGIDCFADDTGLEVAALNGSPGVFSARYAGEDKNSIKNMSKLLDELKHEQDRSAQFRTVICFIQKGSPVFFKGVVKGTIMYEPKGAKGFGYDPVFQPEGFNKTFAEMSLEEKNKISHRAIAFGKLIAFLNQDKIN